MKFAILHTTPATVEPLKALAAELLPGWGVINIVDDSILPQLASSGGDLSQVEERLVAYARFAEGAGARAILEACSSVGELAAKMRLQVAVPVIRIDEAMAEAAVKRGRKIGVAATLATTLEPTLRLLQEKAAEAGRAVELQPVLVGEAYERLMSGDQAGHDDLLAAVLAELSEEVDAIALAQASMARVLPWLPAAGREKFLTSPRLAMEKVKAALEAGGV